MPNNYWGSIYGPSTCEIYHGPGSEYNDWNGNGDKIYGKIDYTPYVGYEIGARTKFNKEQGVYTPTGNYSNQSTDMQVSCLDSALVFQRSYNSQNTDAGSILGNGWTFNFDAYITSDSDYQDILLVRLPDDTNEAYEVNEDGMYTSLYSRNTITKQNDGTYILQDVGNRIKYQFNANGKLSMITSKEGNNLTLSYSEKGLLKSITDYVGRYYYFTFDNNLLTCVKDALGRTVNYFYDENNRLSKVINDKGISTNYSYSGDGYLTVISDANNNVIEAINYVLSDGIVKVNQHTDQYGNTKTYSYDEASRMTTVIDSYGRSNTVYYDNSLYITKTVEDNGELSISSYSKNDGINKYGEESSVTDNNGYTESYERDSSGNILSVESQGSDKSSYEYDRNNNLISVCDENGNYTYYIYDESGTYLLKEVKPLNGIDIYSPTGDQKKYSIITYTYYQPGENGYNVKGLLKSITDPEGNVIIYTYDQYGNKSSTTDSEGNLTTYIYNTLGWLISEKSPKGYAISYTYDIYGNLVDTVQPGGEITHNVYDTLGRKVQEITPNIYKITKAGDVGYRYAYYPSGKIQSMTDPMNNITSYSYDIYGNLVTETKPNGSSYHYDYDSSNRIINKYFKNDSMSEWQLLKSYSYNPANGDQITNSETVYLNDMESATTYYVYNLKGELINQVNPDGGQESKSYNLDGTLYLSTDAQGYITYYKYDRFGRLTEQWTQIDDDKYSYCAYKYDKNDNVIAEVSSAEKVSLWSVPANKIMATNIYGPDNRLISAVAADGGRTNYTYDAEGNITKEIQYIDSNRTKTIDYTTNYLGKISKVTEHIDSSDIYSENSSTGIDISLETTYNYDNNGNILSKILPDKTVYTYSYDYLDRILSETRTSKDEYNQTLTISKSYTYNSDDDNKSSYTDEKGNVTSYVYDKRRQLIKEIDSMGGITAYVYDNAGRQIAKVSPQNYVENDDISNMNRVVFVYDNMNHVILEQDIYHDGSEDAFKIINAKAYQYNQKGLLVKELDSLGYESGSGESVIDKINTGYGTVYTYDGSGQQLTVLSPESSDNGYTYDKFYTYDAAGRKISEAGTKGGVINYYYDNVGRLIKITIKDGTEKTLQQEVYDFTGNVTKQVDGNGNVTLYTYNDLGLLRSQTSYGDAYVDEYEISYKYNLLGDRVFEEDSMGKVLLYAYNENHKILSQTEKYRDGTQMVSKTNAYDVYGNLRFESDANGNITEYKYDTLNRITHKIQTVGGESHITKYSYDKNGNLLSTTDWLGNKSVNGYDALNRLISKKNPKGIIVETYAYNDNNAQIVATDAQGKRTLFSYDKNNRLISTVDPMMNDISQKYDPESNIISKTDANGNTTEYVYDTLNQLLEVTNDKGEKTTYTYDLNGNILTIKNSKGGVIYYKYNVLNKAVSESDINNPENKTLYYYNPNGTLKKKVDKNDDTILYSYDVHENLLSEIIVGGGTTIYTYDGNGNVLKIVDGNGATTMTYDELGRVTQKTVPVYGSIISTYDSKSNVASGFYKNTFKDVKGNVTTKIYNNLDQLVKVVSGDNTAEYTYYDDGSQKSVTYSNGYKEIYSYYDNHLLKTLQNVKANDSILDEYQYTYDDAGNLITKFEIINGVQKGSTSYTYDTLNRLITVIEPSGKKTTYNYDGAGNRILEKVELGNNICEDAYNYDSQNRLLTITEKMNGTLAEITRYRYDKNGNMLESIVDSYTDGSILSSYSSQVNTYNEKNQLIKSINQDGTTVNNTYDSDGYRIVKSVDGVSTYYLYEDKKVVLELNSDGSQAARNIYGNNLLLRTTGNETYYYMYNGHADVTALLTGTGIIAATYYYDAFGNILESTGEVDNSYLYSGYQYDVETGLYNLNSRMYNPDNARFLQEDEFLGLKGDPLSLNRYTYCTNNPLIYYDPTGHMNWATQTGSLINGITKGVGDSLLGMVTSLPALYDVAKLLVTGKISVKDLLSSGIQGMVEDYRFIIKNISYLDPRVKVSNKQVKEYGVHFGGIISDIALTLMTGAGVASKVSEVISKVKGGKKLLKALEKFGSKEGKFYKSTKPYDILNEKGISTTLTKDEIKYSNLADLKGKTPTGKTPKSGSKVDTVPQKVIGHYPEYVELSTKLNTKPFSIPDNIWNKMTVSEQWTANQKFLDRAIAKGTEFNLATPLNKVRPGSYLQKEIEYLISQGYKLSSDGAKLIK